MKITESRIRRIIRESLILEIDPSQIGGTYTDAQVEWETQVIDDETGETVADVMRGQETVNPVAILAVAAADLALDTGEWVIDLLISGVELRINLASYLSPIEGSQTSSEEYLQNATDAAYEVAVGNLMWYGLNALGPIGRKLKRKVRALRKSKVTVGKPTSSQQEDLIRFRSEVLTDDVVAAGSRDVKNVAEVVDGAIHANRTLNYKKPPAGPVKSARATAPLAEPSHVRYFDDLPDTSGYLPPQSVIYNVSHKGEEISVIFYKNTQSSAVDITFVPKNASWDMSMTGRGEVRTLLGKVVDSVKSYNNQFPQEKSFVFSGVPHGTGYLEKGAAYATKRDRTYNMFMDRAINRDPHLSSIVSSTQYQTLKGADGRPQGVTLISLKELHRLIREELNELFSTKSQVLLENNEYPDDIFDRACL